MIPERCQKDKMYSLTQFYSQKVCKEIKDLTILNDICHICRVTNDVRMQGVNEGWW